METEEKKHTLAVVQQFSSPLEMQNTHTQKKCTRPLFMALPAQMCVLMMSRRHLEAI